MIQFHRKCFEDAKNFEFSLETNSNKYVSLRASHLRQGWKKGKYNGGMPLKGAACRNLPAIEDQFASEKQATNIKTEEFNKQYATQGTACNSFVDVADKKFSWWKYWVLSVQYLIM